MFKSIFSKLIIVFVTILILSFTVTGVMLYFFLGDFASSEKVKMLEDSSMDIGMLLNFYVNSGNNPVAAVYLQSRLERYSTATHSIIWIVDKEGRIAFSEPKVNNMSDQIKNELRYEAGSYMLPDERQYEEVISGNDILKEVGNFYGVFKDTKESWLTIARPVKHQMSNGMKETIAAVFLHTPVPEIYEARASVFKLFIFSVAVSVVVSIILTYIFSLRISRPLKEIKEASMKIAGGEFENRLRINRNDEIGELARSFNNMADDLRKLEQMRRDFVANVSHELRTPMTSIRGFISGIIDGTIPADKQNEYLSVVMDETNRLNRLVNDLLDLGRMEAGEMKLKLQVFDINELIRRCIIKLENIIVKKDIQIEADFEKEKLLTRADMDAISRVVINLVHNSVKFTPRKGKIVISTSTIEERVLVGVKDNGIGIEKDELNMVWHRFHKSDKSRGKDKTGTGLGLAIARNIINEHNQEIWVESEKGKGSTFLFTLEKIED